MRTKTLISLAVIAALPITAMAENISGAMYTAPSAADNNHPAPTTQAYAPYGRIDIDTADQEHIATTAYVKGAYNSAIAAVNKVRDEMRDGEYNLRSTLEEGMDAKQDKLTGLESQDAISTMVFDDDSGVGTALLQAYNEEYAAMREDIGRVLQADSDNPDNALISAGAVFDIVRDAGTVLQGNINTVQSSVTNVQTALNNKRVEIYTTWNNDNAKTQVAFVNAPAQQ